MPPGRHITPDSKTMIPISRCTTTGHPWSPPPQPSTPKTCCRVQGSTTTKLQPPPPASYSQSESKSTAPPQQRRLDSEDELLLNPAIPQSNTQLVLRHLPAPTRRDLMREAIRRLQRSEWVNLEGLVEVAILELRKEECTAICELGK